MNDKDFEKIMKSMQDVVEDFEKATGKTIQEMAKELGIEVPKSLSQDHHPAYLKIYNIDKNQKELKVNDGSKPIDIPVGICVEAQGRKQDIIYNMGLGIAEVLNQLISDKTERKEMLEIMYNHIKEEI